MAKKEAQIGVAAFIVGLLIAVVLGVWPELMVAPRITNTILVLGVLGIIVGLLNVGDKELDRYLMANIAFLLAGAALSTFLVTIPQIGLYLVGILANVSLFVAPGAAIIALKELYEVAKE
jgi:hypothetical protein